MENITNLINKDTVFFIDGEIDKNKFFNEVFDDLENYYKIGSLNALRESILKKEKISNNITAIGNQLAIPHGIFFDYTYKYQVIMPIFFVKNGVKGYVSEFDEQEVKFLFLIGYNQDTYCTKRTDLLPKIAKVFSNEDNIKLLESSNSSEQLYENLIKVFGE